MKSTVNKDAPTKSRSFPKLMFDQSKIVLFESINSGVVVGLTEHSLFRVGESSINFNSNNFKDFEGSVTLSNE